MSMPLENDSSKIIQNMKFLMEDMSAMRDKLDSHDEKFLTLISQNALIVRSLEKLALGRKKSSHQRHRQKDKRKQNPTTNKGSDTDWSHLLHLPTALQQNITHFTRDLSFIPTRFPDKLIEEGCLSESECENICAKSSVADQIRLLIKKIKGRGPETIKRFLDIIKEDKAFEHLATAVEETASKNMKQKPMCAYCVMRKTVDLKDIADHLWENRLVSDEVYGSIIETGVPANMQYLWSLVVHFINTARDPYTAKHVLKESLKPKYEHLVQPLAEHQDPVQHPDHQGRLLSCTCRARRTLMQRHASTGSQTDFSVSSDYQSKVPNFCLFQSQENSESENYPSLDSTDQISSSLSSYNYSNLKKFDDDSASPAPESGTQMSPDTTTLDCDVLLKALEENKQKSRHSSGRFLPQEHDQLESGQFGSLPFINSEDLTTAEGNNEANAATDRPDCFRSLSNTTVIGKSSVAAKDGNTSSDEAVRRTSDSNTTISPDTVKGLHLSLQTSDGMTGPSSSSPDKENKLPKLILKKLPCRTRKSQTYRHKSEDSSSCPEDNDSDEDRAYKRIRHKTFRRRLLNRQRSAPVGFILTQPKPKTDSTVGVRTLKSGGKKSSKKRAERRIKANLEKPENSGPTASGGVSQPPSMPQGFEGEGYDHSIPYNPSWTHRPQQRTTSQWDHLQARRFWRMAQLLAASNTTGEFQSDSDLRTEDSDAMAVTDDNTV